MRIRNWTLDKELKLRRVGNTFLPTIYYRCHYGGQESVAHPTILHIKLMAWAEKRPPHYQKLPSIHTRNLLSGIHCFELQPVLSLSG